MKIEQLINYWIIGWSGNQPEYRHIGNHFMREGGWKSFVENQVKPVLAKGIRRLEIHNPFGCLDNEAMQADQFIEAKQAGHIMDFDTKGFQKAWRPITSQGIEVIAYFGTPVIDNSFLELRKKKWAVDDYLRRLIGSYNVAIDAGCSIAFDAASGLTELDPEYHFIRMLNALKVKTYIEAWPVKTSPMLSDMSHFTSSQFHPRVMENLELPLDHAQRWAMDPKIMTGEKIQILTHIPFDGETWGTYHQWCPRWVNETISKFGETPCFGLSDEFLNSKQTVEEYLGF